MKGPTVAEIEASTERVKARRRATTEKHVTELIAKVRRLEEVVRLQASSIRMIHDIYDEAHKRLEALERTSCKLAITIGAPCPTLGDRCEICEREAEAEWYKAKVLGEEQTEWPPGYGDKVTITLDSNDETQTKKAEE